MESLMDCEKCPNQHEELLEKEEAKEPCVFKTN